MLLERIGLIDIGSNTIRLVIFEIDEHFTIYQEPRTPVSVFEQKEKDVPSRDRCPHQSPEKFQICR